MTKCSDRQIDEFPKANLRNEYPAGLEVAPPNQRDAGYGPLPPVGPVALRRPICASDRAAVSYLRKE